MGSYQIRRRPQGEIDAFVLKAKGVGEKCSDTMRDVSRILITAFCRTSAQSLIMSTAYEWEAAKYSKELVPALRKLNNGMRQFPDMKPLWKATLSTVCEKYGISSQLVEEE